MKVTLLALLVFFSCNPKSSDAIPEIFKPQWEGVDSKGLPVQFGDVVSFAINDIIVKAIVLDVENDETGAWIGMCFLNKNKLFGRQIPNGYSGNCIDLLDCTYIESSNLIEFDRVASKNIDINIVGIGSRSSAANYTDLLRDYNLGLTQRTKKQTKCNEDVLGLNPVHECYFDLNRFLK